MSEFILKVNGIEYGGWKSYRIQRSVEQVSGVFSLAVSDRWAVNQERRAINPDDQCELVYGDLTLIKGHADQVGISYDAESHSINVSGRDLTADLVDCSAQHATGQIFDNDLTQVAKLLVAPYGISVVADVSVAPAFAEVTIDDGESIYDVIERLARHRGVLLISDKGQLRITKPSTKRIPTPLVLGQNIKSCDANISTRERYHTYLVKTQSAADDSWPGQQAAESNASITDPKIRAPRLKIIVAEEGNNADDCRARGRWQRNIATARGTSINYVCQGHEYADGMIWRENRMVRVVDPFLSIEDDLFIASVEYSKDDSGTHTNLTVAPRAAYETIAVPEKQEAF